MEIISASFINNRAGICGGAGDIAGNGIIFRDTIVKGNSDSAFCISGDLSFIGGTNFSKNTGGLGGALYIHPESHVSFTGHSTFDGNIANSGGAISLNGVNLAFDMNISFSHNMARADGGAIYARFRANVTFHILATINIHSNSAQNGGAIYLNSGASLMFMEGVELTASHNHASESFIMKMSQQQLSANTKSTILFHSFRIVQLALLCSRSFLVKPTLFVR